MTALLLLPLLLLLVLVVLVVCRSSLPSVVTRSRWSEWWCDAAAHAHTLQLRRWTASERAARAAAIVP